MTSLPFTGELLCIASGHNAPVKDVRLITGNAPLGSIRG